MALEALTIKAASSSGIEGTHKFYRILEVAVAAIRATRMSAFRRGILHRERNTKHLAHLPARHLLNHRASRLRYGEQISYH